MIDKSKIPLEKKNSLYLRMQTKLLEIEYDKKCNLIVNNFITDNKLK